MCYVQKRDFLFISKDAVETVVFSVLQQKMCSLISVWSSFYHFKARIANRHVFVEEYLRHARIEGVASRLADAERIARA